MRSNRSTIVAITLALAGALAGSAAGAEYPPPEPMDEASPRDDRPRAQPHDQRGEQGPDRHKVYIEIIEEDERREDGAMRRAGPPRGWGAAQSDRQRPGRDTRPEFRELSPEEVERIRARFRDLPPEAQDRIRERLRDPEVRERIRERVRERVRERDVERKSEVRDRAPRKQREEEGREMRRPPMERRAESGPDEARMGPPPERPHGRGPAMNRGERGPSHLRPGDERPNRMGPRDQGPETDRCPCCGAEAGPKPGRGQFERRGGQPGRRGGPEPRGRGPVGDDGAPPRSGSTDRGAPGADDDEVMFLFRGLGEH